MIRFTWIYQGGYQHAGRCHRVWRDEKLSVQREMVADRHGTRYFYFIDSNPCEFESEAALIEWVRKQMALELAGAG